MEEVWPRGFIFSTAAMTLLCKSVEEYASLRFLRGREALEHGKKQTLTVADLRFGSKVARLGEFLQQ